MNFGDVINMVVNEGHCARRAGWNGKGMHIYAEASISLRIGDGVFKGQVRKLEPCVVLFNAQGQHQPGWVPSQQDMFAKDWEVVTGP